MLLPEAVEAYKKEGPKFMQRPGRQTEGQGERLMTWAGKAAPLVWHELFRVFFQHGGHAGLITAATSLVRLDRAFFKAQSDQNLAR
jgi:hypothetical protein